MKYIVSESQYKILLTEDRLDYLKTQHVMTKRQVDDLTKGEKESEVEREPGGLPPKKSIKVVPIQDESGVDIAYLYTSKKGKTSVKLTEEIFNDIAEADPTRNKAYVSWMISVFLRHISDNDINQAVRFLTEDLPEATEFLEVFDRVKKKKVFKTGAPNRPNAPSDVSDISQYNDLAHLYSIVSPFVGTGDDDDEDATPGEKLWKKLKKYIDLGHARLAYRDNDVLVYIPDTIEASCDPLGNLASWCTRRENNSYFDSYRNNNRKPNGDPSDFYAVIPKTMFDGEPTDDSFYPLQLHFETGQLHNKNNSNIGDDGLKKLIKQFPGFKTYFTQELGALAAEDVKEGDGLMKSKYIDYLNKFGGRAQDVISDEIYQQGVKNIRNLAAEQQVPLQQNKYLKWLMENTDGVNVTDYLNRDIETLDFSNMSLGVMPDLSEFTSLRRLTANGCSLKKLPPVKHLPKENKINVFSFANNEIKEAPIEGYQNILIDMFLFNMDNNPITKINVKVLSEMVTKSGLSRFTYSDDILDKLTPENKKDFEKFLADDDEIGYFTA